MEREYGQSEGNKQAPGACKVNPSPFNDEMTNLVGGKAQSRGYRGDEVPAEL